MALRILFGSDTESLAGRLAAEIQATYRDVDPLVPATILVPNRNLEKWLRFAIARNLGVAANLKFPYLEHGLWQIVSEIGVLSGRIGEVANMKSETVAARIAVVLLAATADPDEGKSKLLDYCRAGCDPATPSLSDPGFAVRLWQLSERLARLFREYEFSRTDMVRGWLDGRLSYDSPDDSSGLEREQAAIYRQVFGDERRFDDAGRTPQRTLFQLAEAVFSDLPTRASGYSGAGGAPVVTNAGDTIFVFGMSSLSRYHCGLLWKISKFRDVCVYHFNTCREYWEDVSTPFEDRWREIRRTETVPEQDSDELVFHYDLSDNPLLKAWGKAGRETVKLLADLEDDAENVEAIWVDDQAFDKAMFEGGAGGSVLSRVQYGILNRTSDVGTCKPDSSITIMSCPGVQREVEAIADEISDLLRRDPTLRLSDIAVLVTNMADYKPFISQVFGRDRNAVPYNMADSNASEDSVYGYGVKALINLVCGDYSRRCVFELLYNPCFQAAAGIGTGDLAMWLKWVTGLGVYHDFYRGSIGTEANVYTWSQALQRIRLGRIMNPDDAVFPYRDSDTDTAVADRFCETIERLFHRTNSLLSGKNNPSEWGLALKALFDSFLAVPLDRPEEGAVRRALCDGLFACFGDDTGFGPAIRCVGGKVELNQNVVFEVIKSLLTGITTGRGAYLSDGVTVASLKPMRPIPFRVIFVAGLAEGKFPGSIQESSVDLRIRHRRIGDVTTPDAGRYMFMETMLCARDRLILSYDGWDTQKDERHEPCSVVRQLMNHLSQSVVTPDAGGRSAAYPIVAVSLSPFSVAAARDSALDKTAATGRMRDRIVAAVLTAGSEGRLPELAAAAGKAIARAGHAGGSRDDVAALGRLINALAAANPVDVPSDARSIGISEPLKIRIRLKDLAAFLENPMKARTRRILGTYDSGEDPGAAFVEDEPFAFEKTLSRDMNTMWLRDFVRTGDAASAQAGFVAQAARLHAMSLAPGEPFAGSHAASMKGVFDKLVSSVPPAFFQRNLIADVVTGLDTWNDRDPSEKYPAIVAPMRISADNSRCCDVELRGGVDFMATATSTAPVAYVAVRDSGGTPPRFVKGVFEPMLYGLMYAAYGTGAAEPFDVYEISKGGMKAYRFDVDRAAARTYLTDLIVDYLDDSRLLELLPYIPVATVFAKVDLNLDSPPDDLDQMAARLAEAIEEAAKSDHGGYYPSEAEQLLGDRADIPVALWQTVVRRYGVPWGASELDVKVSARKGRVKAGGEDA